MKQNLKITRRRDLRRARPIAFEAIAAPRAAPRDLVAYAAALEILG
jgi:hypothetical protein